MSPFGRRQQSENRTPQERERARLEREARRAEREGRPVPAPPPGEPAWVDEAEPEAPAWPEAPAPAADERNGDSASPADAWAPSRAAEEPAAPPADWAPDPVGEQPADVAPPAWDAPETAAPPPDPSWDDPDPVSFDPPAPEERPAWDDTGAWDPEPPASPPPAATPDPAPPLGDELAAVDRGWFEDDEHVAERHDPQPEPGQETVEWDVLEGRPKTRPEPPSGPAGGDAATVEWDVLSEAPKPAVPEERQTPDPSPTSSTPIPPPRTAPAPAPPRPAAPRPSACAVAAGATPRFGDEAERPVPTRRVSRARTLPPPPPGPGEKPRRRPGRGTVLVVVLVLVLALGLFFVNALFQPLADEGTGDVRVAIPQNSSSAEVGDILEREGVVDSSFFFQLRSRLAGAELKAGNFTLKEGMKYGSAIAALEANPEAPPTVSITIPEGRARRETAPLIQEAGLRGSYLQASERGRGFSTRRYGAPRNLRSLEGFLFPATYELEPGSSSRDLVAQQLEAFEQNIEGVSMRRARDRNLSTFDVLTIASMIDREATIDRERRLISAVIHNRLRDGMPLGIDATIRFATRNWTRPLRVSELEIDSPYNTRRRTGLPPGPIGSPGLAAIKAAADPANVDYLYYVVKPCGKGAHNFSASDTEFERDRQAYERKRAELGGQSPVDC